MAEEMNRVEIGFGSGQVTSARLAADKLAELRRSLGSSGGEQGWYDLEAEDAVITLDLRQVVFVRVAGAPHTIGFSGD